MHKRHIQYIMKNSKATTLIKNLWPFLYDFTILAFLAVKPWKIEDWILYALHIIIWTIIIVDLAFYTYSFFRKVIGKDTIPAQWKIVHNRINPQNALFCITTTLYLGYAMLSMNDWFSTLCAILLLLGIGPYTLLLNIERRRKNRSKHF